MGEPESQPSPPSSRSSTPKYSFYISAADEDKTTIALPLREMLRDRGITAFVDIPDIPPGTDAAQTMMHAMETANTAIFVLSPEFVARKWPMKGLMHFLERREHCLHIGAGDPPVIIPFFYRLSPGELYHEPRLDRRDKDGNSLYDKSRFYERQRNGDPEANISNIKAALRALRRFVGIENFENATNESSSAMHRRRRMLLDGLCVKIMEAGVQRGVDPRILEKALRDGEPARLDPGKGVTRFSIESSSAMHRRRRMLLDGLWVKIMEAGVQRGVDPRILEKALRDGEPARLDTVRLMVLGAPSRGKTSTIASLRRKPFDDSRNSTIGVDLSIHYIALGDHDLTEAQIEHLDKLSKFQARYREYEQRQIHAAEASRGDIPVEGNESNVHSSNNSATNAVAVADSQPTDPVPSEVYNIVNKRSEISDVAIPNCITLRCWDFGGQPEYEVAHELFISPRSIVMFVFDLPLFEDRDSQDEEVVRLQHWIQTVYAATPENELCDTFSSIVIVGTKRDKCKRLAADKMFRTLRGKLSDRLDSKITDQWDVWKFPMIAIENEIAVENKQGSGLTELEEHLKLVAAKIVKEGTAVPLRWLAFLERLHVFYDDPESWQRLSMNQHDVERVSMGLHFSSERLEGVNAEVENCLKYLRNLGELVLFEMSDPSFVQENGSYILFPRPERILQALKVIVAPEEVRCHGLSGTDRIEMRKGVLTCRAVERKWSELDGLSSQEERQKLLSLMTSMDIFIHLKSSGERGVPSLLETRWDDLKWLEYSDDPEREVHALTRFEACIPFGFIGTFIGRLHRIIGNEQTDIRLIRGNAVLLTPRGVKGSERFQIFVGFRHEKRELHWKVRGPTWNFGLLLTCLSEFEAHKSERQTGREVGATHYMLTGCPQKKCDKKFGLEFKISLSCDDGRHWREKVDVTIADFSRSCGIAICDNVDCYSSATLSQAIGVTAVSEKPSVLRSPRRAEFEVFISHAGPDKHTTAYPLYQKLKLRGISAFLDRTELKAGYKAVPEMKRAMGEAPILVAITSPEFCIRQWPIKELRKFLRRHKGAKDSQVDLREGGGPVIIPLFYRLDVGKCRHLRLEKLRDDDEYNMNLFQELMKRTDNDAKTKLRKIQKSMKSLSEFTGIENEKCASNENSPEMEEKRNWLLDKVVNHVVREVEKIRG